MMSKVPVNELPSPRAEIESKAPHRTCWLTLYYPENDGSLLAEARTLLAAEGWREDREFAPVSPLDGVAEAHFYSPGTAIFNGWTLVESRKKMAALKRALAKLGPPVYRRKLTLADCL